MSNQPPIEVPQGAIRLNTDSQKLEFFAQDRWYEFATDSPILDGGGRGICIPGDGSSGHSNVRIYYDTATLETQQILVTLSKQFYEMFGFASRTRAVFGGGNNGGDTDAVDYFIYIINWQLHRFWKTYFFW